MKVKEERRGRKCKNGRTLTGKRRNKKTKEINGLREVKGKEGLGERGSKGRIERKRRKLDDKSGGGDCIKKEEEDK